MTRQKNDQIPLGELLTKARLDKHMSRAQLAKETRISENSLVRYEKAGLEDDGQYPPSPKLAKLCFALDIPPLTILFSSLSPEEYWEEKGYTWENWLNDHPDYEYLVEQWFTLTKENRKLTTALKLLVGPTPEPGSFKEKELNWIKDEVRQIIDIQDAFYHRLGELGLPDDPERMPFMNPGNPAHNGRPAKISAVDYADFVKNGPDHDDPSRPDKTTNNPEAVDAASTNPPKKGKTDEVI